MADMDEEYVERMDDVLDLYVQESNPEEPIVCMDEKSKQIINHAKEPIAMKPWKPKKISTKYKRWWTKNIFVAVEPKIWYRQTQVTDTRKKIDYAVFIERIYNRHRHVKTIHLVQDNLNTHNESSLIEKFWEKKGKRIWAKFTLHYTPKNWSWLNMAEIEIWCMDRQCLWARVESVANMDENLTIRQRNRNKQKVKINRTFTKEKAHEKLSKYIIPKLSG